MIFVFLFLGFFNMFLFFWTRLAFDLIILKFFFFSSSSLLQCFCFLLYFCSIGQSFLLFFPCFLSPSYFQYLTWLLFLVPFLCFLFPVVFRTFCEHSFHSLIFHLVLLHVS